MSWHKAMYVMKYAYDGKVIQHEIIADNLHSAKLQARTIAEKNNLGIMYSLTLVKSVYKY